MLVCVHTNQLVAEQQQQALCNEPVPKELYSKAQLIDGRESVIRIHQLLMQPRSTIGLNPLILRHCFVHAKFAFDF